MQASRHLLSRALLCACSVGFLASVSIAWAWPLAEADAVIPISSTAKSPHAATQLAKALTRTSAAVPSLIQKKASSVSMNIGWEPIADAPLHVAMAQKLFAKFGIEPRFYQFSSGTAGLAAMKAGSIDVFEEGPGPMVLGHSEGIDQITFMIAEDQASTSGLIAQPDSGIKSVSDLKGKSVGTLIGSGEYIHLVLQLKAHHIFNSVKIVGLNPAGVLAAFKRHDVDAAWMWDPWSQLLVAEGGKLVSTDLSLGMHTPVAWVANQKWARSHQSVLSSFIATINAAIIQVKDKPAAAKAALAPVMHVTPAVLDFVVENLSKHDGWPSVKQQLSPNYALSLTAGYSECSKGLATDVQHISEILLSLKRLKHVPSCHDIYDPRYLRSAEAVSKK